MNLGLQKDIRNEFELAKTFFGIISVVNNLELTNRDLQVLAYVAIRGTITGTKRKREFIRLFGSSLASISNTVFKLKTKHFLLRKGTKVVLNPQLAMKIENINININLKLQVGNTKPPKK